MSRDGALWIGGLEPYMDEDFIRGAFAAMGETNVLTIKIIKNKFTGEPASYGFVNFDSDPSALMAMHKLNGKIMPNSQPPICFQLNHASAKQSGYRYSEREFSIWVSNLSEDVSERDLHKTFGTRYESVKAVKVIDEDGSSRKFGFVRFGDQNDQREALIHMNGFQGLGSKPIKVSVAIPKPGLSEGTSLMADAYSNPSYTPYYEQYWSDKAAWSNYGSFQGQTSAPQPVLLSSQALAAAQDFDFNDEEQEGDEEKLIAYDTPLNVDAMNTEFIARSQQVWADVEKERWLFDLDQEEGFVPNFKKNPRTTDHSISNPSDA